MSPLIWNLLFLAAGGAVGYRLARRFGAAAIPAVGEAPAPAAAPVAREIPCPPGEWMDICGEAVLILDARDRILKFNAAAAAAFRLGADAVGADAAVLVRSADFIRVLQEIRAGVLALPVSPASAIEVTVRRGPREADAVFRLAAAMSPESAGCGAGALCLVFADLTRLRRLESLRGEFIANVSHDLRTPVTIIKGYVRTLEEDFAVMEEEDRRRFLEKTRRATDRLQGLLESLLELAQSESGTTGEPVWGSLHAAVAETAEFMRDRLAAAGLETELVLSADDTAVGVDPFALRRVVQNLLENAARYAKGASRVRLVSRNLPDGGVELRVEDDGPGVAEADYEKLFRRFYRAEKSRSLAHGGAGLGLSIVKSLVLAQGGEVRAEPVTPRGFAIVMGFPAAVRDAAGAV